MANETNNATVTGLITLAKGCFMFHGPVRVIDHEVSRIENIDARYASMIQRGSAPALISVNESPLRLSTIKPECSAILLGT